MQILTDEKGYITSFALVGTLVGGQEAPLPEDTAHFEQHFTAYRIRDGDLFFDEVREQALAKAAGVDTIRQRRERECFSVINRGQLWYARLTEKQSMELNEWYQAWLDATSTGAVPDRPAWL